MNDEVRRSQSICVQRALRGAGITSVATVQGGALRCVTAHRTALLRSQLIWTFAAASGVRPLTDLSLHFHMHPHLAHVFVDGGYLRVLAREHNQLLVNPRDLASQLMKSGAVQTWAFNPGQDPNAFLGRVQYYDALPDDASPQKEESEAYWREVEKLEDVHLGFGALRGLKRNMRQKGVDTLMAVDMLVGAFSGLFDIAVLVAGDADFVPVVEEVKRRGVMVAVAGVRSSLADDLLRAADRFIDMKQSDQFFPTMRVSGRTWAT